MKVKICGLFRAEDIEFANQVMPDYVGFVFAESRRQITVVQARNFRDTLSHKIQTVGVFVNAPREEILSLLTEGVIDIAQLHGEETEEDIAYLKKMTGKPIIKAIRVSNRQDVEQWLPSKADFLLFDSGAGSGVSFPWEILKEVKREYFLAGGLRAENIPDALRMLTPYAIDLSSGVETEGVKDLRKMQEVVKLVRTACPVLQDEKTEQYYKGEKGMK